MKTHLIVTLSFLGSLVLACAAKAKDNKLFLTVASKALKWDQPTEPVKIAGPLYFVGTRGLSSFLFVTSEGNILFNTGLPSSGPMIVESIKKLGFQPEDIKVIITAMPTPIMRVPSPS